MTGRGAAVVVGLSRGGWGLTGGGAQTTGRVAIRRHQSRVDKERRLDQDKGWHMLVRFLWWCGCVRCCCCCGCGRPKILDLLTTHHTTISAPTTARQQPTSDCFHAFAVRFTVTPKACALCMSTRLPINVQCTCL